MAGYDLGTARGRIDIDASSLGRATGGLDAMGRSMLITGALGVAAFVGVVKTASDFEKVMSAVGAVSNASEKDMARLRDTALDLGTKTAYSAQEVGQAMEDLAKAGLTIDEIVGGAAEATTTLAAAAGEELPGGIAQGAEIIANAMKTFDASAQDLNHFADVLVGAAASSTINVEDMATTLKYAGPIAHELGIDIDDLSTSIAILGDRGIKGSTAGTSLRGVLLSLSPTSKKAADKMKELGFITKDGTNLFFDQYGALKPLPEVMQLLQEKTKGMSQEAKVAAFNQIFQRRAMNSALILADQGAKGFDRYSKSIKKISAADIAKKKLDNLQGALKILKSSVNALMIQAGTPFLDMLKGWVQGLTKVVNYLARMDPQILSTVLKIIAIAGAIGVALGSGLLFLSMMLKMYRAFKDVQAAIVLFGNMMKLTFLSNPVFLVVAAIVALAVALYFAYTKSETFRNIVDQMIDGIQAFLQPLTPIIDALKNFGNQMVLLFNLIKDGQLTVEFFSAILDRAFGGNGRYAEFFTTIYNAVVTVFNWIKDTAIPAAERFIQAVDWERVLKIAGVVLFALAAPLLAVVLGLVHAYQKVGWFRKAVQATVKWIKENFGPLLTDIANLLKAILPKIVSFAKSLPPIFRAALRLITTVFKWFFGVAKNIWELFGDNILNLVKTVFDLIKSQISAALRVIRGIIQIVTGLIDGDWGQVWEGIKKVFSGIWAGILSILKTAVRLIVIAVQSFFDAIHAVWDAGWSFIKEVVPAAWNYMLQIMKRVIGTILGVVGHFIEMMLAPFIWLYDELVGHSVIPDMMNAIKDVIRRGLTAVVEFFAGLPGRVLRGLGNIINTLSTKGGDLVTGLFNGIKFVWETVNSWFGGLPGKVLRAIGDLGSLLYNAGKDIVQGLMDGLSDMIRPLTDALGNITDMIPLKKGPPSKDKVLLRKNGQLIMSGLEKGLRSSFPDIERTLLDATRLFETADLRSNTSTLRGTGTATKGQTINVTLEFPLTTPASEPTIKAAMQDTQFLPTLIRGIRSGVGSANR